MVISASAIVCRRCKELLGRSLFYRSLSTQTNIKSCDDEEVDKFNKLSDTWWADKKDALYLMNSVRVPLITSLARDIDIPHTPDITVLDVGCGGGYLAEELAKQRYNVTGIDPSSDMIKIATQHADRYPGELGLEYKCGTVEDITQQFDIVVSSEVAEHVPCVKSFVMRCADRVKPGGGLMFTTINRTVRSWLFAIMLAEHVAGLVPPGTHDYSKLVPPRTLTGHIADCGFKISGVTGLAFNPVTRQWSTTSDLAINYAVTALKT